MSHENILKKIYFNYIINKLHINICSISLSCTRSFITKKIWIWYKNNVKDTTNISYIDIYNNYIMRFCCTSSMTHEINLFWNSKTCNKYSKHCFRINYFSWSRNFAWMNLAYHEAVDLLFHILCFLFYILNYNPWW